MARGLHGDLGGQPARHGEQKFQPRRSRDYASAVAVRREGGRKFELAATPPQFVRGRGQFDAARGRTVTPQESPEGFDGAVLLAALSPPGDTFFRASVLSAGGDTDADAGELCRNNGPRRTPRFGLCWTILFSPALSVRTRGMLYTRRSCPSIV
jgi:hypothetical protein